MIAVKIYCIEKHYQTFQNNKRFGTRMKSYNSSAYRLFNYWRLLLRTPAGKKNRRVKPSKNLLGQPLPKVIRMKRMTPAEVVPVDCAPCC